MRLRKGVALPRPGRRFAILTAGFIAVTLIAWLAAGWYLAGVIQSGLLKPDYSPDELNLVVVSIEEGRIVLTEHPDKKVESLKDDELWGLEGKSGYGQVGDVLQINGNEVTREFRLLSGSLASGDSARLDSFAFKGDPLSA